MTEEVEVVDITTMDSNGWAEHAVAPGPESETASYTPKEISVVCGNVTVEMDGLGHGKVCVDGVPIRYARAVTIVCRVKEPTVVTIETLALGKKR